MTAFPYRRSLAMQVPSEIEAFEALAKARTLKVIVEIGSANGGTLVRWLEIPGVKCVVSIDLPEGIHGGQSLESRSQLVRECREYAERKGIEFYALDGDSKLVLDALKFVLRGRKIDMLFIDGDHSYSGVANDYGNYSPLVEGIIAFHDIVDSAWHRSVGVQVCDFWKYLKDRYENAREFIDTPASIAMWPHTDGWGGIGVIEV